MKQLAAVYGANNRGKTCAIEAALEMLLVAYPEAEADIRRTPRGADVTAVMTVDDFKIGVESRGDDANYLDGRLRCFAKLGCQVIVCATRTRGNTVEAVEEFRKERGCKVKWIDKSKYLRDPEEQDACTESTARRLVEIVQAFVLPNS